MRRLPAELWWNLDGSSTPCALRMLPLLAEELAPGSKRWVQFGTVLGLLALVQCVRTACEGLHRTLTVHQVLRSAPCGPNCSLRPLNLPPAVLLCWRCLRQCASLPCWRRRRRETWRG